MPRRSRRPRGQARNRADILRKDEQAWAFKFIHEHNLATFNAFTAYRKKHGLSVPFTPHETSDVQRKLNRQLGVSAEIFAKYGA